VHDAKPQRVLAGIHDRRREVLERRILLAVDAGQFALLLATGRGTALVVEEDKADGVLGWRRAGLADLGRDHHADLVALLGILESEVRDPQRKLRDRERGVERLHETIRRTLRRSCRG